MRSWARVLPGIRAVLFDLDGTLVDRDAALRAWLRRRAGLGRELERLIELDRADACSLAALSVELHRTRPGLAADPGALARRIRAELPRFVSANPAIQAGVRRLAGELRLGLVSNGGPGQREKLAAAGLPERLFDSIRISGELGIAKPDPAIFEAALADLGVRPEEALMIGDSAEHDIAGAAGLGILTCWISCGRRYPEGCLPPTFVVDDVESLLAKLLARR